MHSAAGFSLGTQKAHKHKHFMGMLLYNGFTWDIPILIFADLLSAGPKAKPKTSGN